MTRRIPIHEIRNIADGFAVAVDERAPKQPLDELYLLMEQATEEFIRAVDMAVPGKHFRWNMVKRLAQASGERQ